VTVLTIEEYQRQPVKERLARMARTPDELADAIRGARDDVLSRRPDETSWSAKEIVCHLRDVEREYIHRFHLMLLNDDPKIYLEPDGNGRWPADLQYVRNDAADAIRAFRRLRGEMLLLIGDMTARELQRGGIHPRRGRVTIDWWIAMLAVHDDDHLAQLARALDGRA
jgi:uncharacterized damage-inducible protein DinB